jgi:hypothetical protein
MADEYEVNTFDDFLEIPFEKLDACLEEFNNSIRRFCHTEKTARQVLNVLSPIPDDKPLMSYSGFTWIDDGKTDVTTRLRITHPMEDPE